MQSQRLEHLLAIIVAAASLAACPGPLKGKRDAAPLVYPDSGAAADYGVADIVPHGDAAAADLQLRPDVGPDGPQASTQPGGPCPCAQPLVCVKGACRSTCTSGGTCGVSSSCPPDQACVPTTKGYGACMPAAAPGQACDAQTYCPNGHLCAAYDNGAHICRPTCTTHNAPCGTGGHCISGSTAGCHFCTAI